MNSFINTFNKCSMRLRPVCAKVTSYYCVHYILDMHLFYTCTENFQLSTRSGGLRIIGHADNQKSDVWVKFRGRKVF